MGLCVEKTSHSCGTRTGLQIFQEFDGSYNGYCFTCGTFVNDPYKDRPADYKPIVHKKSPEEIQAELEELNQLAAVDLPDRKLRGDVLDFYGCKVAFSEQDGITPDVVYFPYTKDGKLKAYRAKVLATGQVWSIGDQKDVDLFGWEQAIASGAKRLIITEGEFDTVALKRIIDLNTKSDFQEYKPAVVSITNGAGHAAKCILANQNKIRQFFKEVVLCFDMDEPGRKAVDEVLKVFPDALSVTLPAKDANACLIEGKSKACFNAVTFKADKQKNTRLVFGSSLREAARKEAEWGYSWPWKHLNDATRGIRLGETIYIGAAPKMGKSEIVNALGAHLIKEHHWKIFMAKPEEANRKTYQLLVGKMAGKIFHDPQIKFDYDAYDKYEPLVGDNVVMVNLYQHLGWQTLKGDIYEAAGMGCKAVFLDPITNLTVGMSAAEANEHLTTISVELAAMALDLNVVIFIFCHLKNSESGPPHDRGGAVLAHQFAGSRSMARSCNYMIGLEGNKDPDIPKEERNIRSLVLLEDREFGSTGRFGLYWDEKTGLFNEM